MKNIKTFFKSAVLAVFGRFMGVATSGNKLCQSNLHALFKFSSSYSSYDLDFHTDG